MSQNIDTFSKYNYANRLVLKIFIWFRMIKKSDVGWTNPQSETVLDNKIKNQQPSNDIIETHDSGEKIDKIGSIKGINLVF